MITDGTTKAYVFKKADSQGMWLSEGETFLGWKLESIDRRVPGCSGWDSQLTCSSTPTGKEPVSVAGRRKPRLFRLHEAQTRYPNTRADNHDGLRRLKRGARPSLSRHLTQNWRGRPLGAVEGSLLLVLVLASPVRPALHRLG